MLSYIHIPIDRESGASKDVSHLVVQAVYNAWEMERHHFVEHRIFLEVIENLRAIQERHPNVIIAAVTNGRSNLIIMPFTLGP